MSTRPRLTRALVLQTALSLADEDGPRALTMRKLAQRLGVEAMSLYHHVANKRDLMAGMIDMVFAEIEVPTHGTWRESMRERAISARAALRRHAWAIGMMDAMREPGPATLSHHNAVIGVLRTGGFDVPMAAHAFALLDSYIYGFAHQELNMPIQTPQDLEDMGEELLTEIDPNALPHLVELMVEHALQPGYAFSDEFLYGLDVILDGLEARRAASLL